MFRGSDIPRVLIIGGFLLLGACSADAPTTPTRPAVKADVIVESSVTTTDSVVVHLRVTPTGGWYQVGKSGVYFPPNSICEPTTTSYGPTEWDKPCTPATGDVFITARTANSGTASWIQFSPDLRFVPSSDSQKWVYLYLYSADVKHATTESRAAVAAASRIFWLPTYGPAVDESLTDATVAPQFHWASGWIYRRVKHFSGYQVGVGGIRVDVQSDDLLQTDVGVGVGL